MNTKMYRKEIVFVTTYPFFDEPVVRNRLQAYINKMSASGWRLSVVAANADIDSERFVEEFTTHKIIHIKVPKYNRANFIKRGVFEVYCSWKLLKAAKLEKADFSVVTIPSMFLLVSSLIRVAPIRIVDIRDLPWEYIPEKKGVMLILKKILRFLAIGSLKRADILTISNRHEVSYIEEKLTGSNYLLVSNGIGADQFNKLKEVDYQGSQASKLRITYIGNVGIAQNLSVLVKVVSRNPGLQLTIVGSGTDFDRVKSEVSSLGATNINMVGRVSWDKVISYYENSDVLYTQLSKEFKTAVPSKLYEYLATGLPIVYGGERSAAIEFLRDFENVWIVNPDSEDSLENAFKDLQSRGKLERSLVNVGKISDNYIRELHVEALENELNTYLTA